MIHLRESKVSDGQIEEGNDVVDDHKLESFLGYFWKEAEPNFMFDDPFIAEHEEYKPETDRNYYHHKDLAHIS